MTEPGAATSGGYLDLLENGSADEFFEKWAAELESSPPWSSGSRQTIARVPYPLLHSPARFQVPDVPGFYLWGANRTIDGVTRLVPRYVGRATSSLLTRLVNVKGTFVQGRGRFVPGPKGPMQDVPEQCALATMHHDQIVKVAAGITNADYARSLRDGLMNTFRKDTVLYQYMSAYPPERLVRFEAKNSPGTLRLRQAIDFALHGGAGLKDFWLALIPIRRGLGNDWWDRVEPELIWAIRRWNESRSLPLPLNALPRI